ncbi:hypothetical protein LTR56_018659 [Elasticomyces elasticus]|nr:hypothetical protein LTR56_018659 [Elasticomyces elasticus]KAK3635670.1 hypothetical protein LTR22_019097 [Elasticomyces elasticus]KAK4933114.1 hypothetical protein LTR49_000598 [Elasticomyces elasticus]KAK5764013.1 hypothetical protein LTS12_005923 [Elasticomyces elasticus]
MQEADAYDVVSSEPHAMGFEQDLHMDFSVDIVEDVAAEVEAVMRLCAFGLFGEARRAADETLKLHLGCFPVLVEYMRLLYDQGDSDMLQHEAERCRQSDCFEDASPGDLEILLLLCDLRRLSSELPSQEDLDIISKQLTRITAILHVPVAYGYAEEAHLRVSLQACQTPRNLLLWRAQELFAIRTGISAGARSHYVEPWSLFSCLLQDLLAKEHYWIAERALELCFWPSGNGGVVLPINDIWHLIEPLIDTPVSFDEDHVLGRLGVLLSFCEGLLNADEAQSAYWKVASSYVAHNSSHMASLYPGLQSVWNRSRAVTRIQLLWVDRSLAEDNYRASVIPATQYITTLRALEVHAGNEHDFQMLRAVKSRILLLSDDVDTASLEHLNNLIPLCIYQARQKHLEGQAKNESWSGSLTSWSNLLNSFREETAPHAQPDHDANMTWGESLRKVDWPTGLWNFSTQGSGYAPINTGRSPVGHTHLSLHYQRMAESRALENVTTSELLKQDRLDTQSQEGVKRRYGKKQAQQTTLVMGIGCALLALKLRVARRALPMAWYPF